MTTTDECPKLKEAIAIGVRGIKEDEARNYKKAHDLYDRCVSMLIYSCKYEIVYDEDKNTALDRKDACLKRMKEIESIMHRKSRTYKSKY